MSVTGLLQRRAGERRNWWEVVSFSRRAGGEGVELTSLEKGSLRRSKSVVRWYRRISRRATVPGLYRFGFRSVRHGNVR